MRYGDPHIFRPAFLLQRLDAMRVTGFSLVADAVRLDFPIREALSSILPLCDEMVVNVGPPEDGTRDLIASMGEPRIRVIGGDWERRQGSAMLALETQRALDAVQGDWAIYIQADEVLHEAGIAPLRLAMQDALGDRAVEGLSVDFLHFYGNTTWLGQGRAWYRREVRALRPGVGIRSFQDAQGFRVGPNARRVRARRSGAAYYHYGWARPAGALAAKRGIDQALYHGQAPGPTTPVPLPWDIGLSRFGGRHPAVMAEWIATRRGQMTDQFRSRPWDARRLALLASLGVERLTGWRPFEYRNYEEV